MHRSICDNDKHSRDHTKPNNVHPESLRVESKCAENRRSGDFDVQAVLLVNQCQESNFIDNECFEAVVKDGQLE